MKTSDLISNKSKETSPEAKATDRALRETRHLQSIPGMRDSIVKGMKTPLSKCAKSLKW